MTEINETQLRMACFEAENYSGYILASEKSTGVIIHENGHIFVKSLNCKSIRDPEIEHILMEKYNLEEVHISGSEPFMVGEHLKIVGMSRGEEK